MKLATIDEVLERLNISKSMAASSTGAIDSALEAATFHLESILRTDLSESQRIDYFSYLPSKFDKPFRTRLWLSQRFVKASVPLEVYFSKTAGTPILDITGMAAEAADRHILNTINGVVDILDIAKQGNSTIAIKYTAGFIEATTAIPKWLREAAISTAVHINHAQSITHGKKDAGKRDKVLSNIVYGMVNEYVITPYGGEYADRTDIL